MININSTYKTFDTKQQRNTFFYYNHKICIFLKNNFDWFTTISEKKYNEISDKIKEISSSKSKEYIEPYYTIYNSYLILYKDIFKKGATFIDCGCAPGGFLKFANDNEMRGYGITLKPTNENKGLFLKYGANVIYGNLLDELFLKSLDNKIQEKVDFINMGAVLYDKGDMVHEQVKLFLNQFYIAKKFLKKNGSIMFVLDIFYTLFNLLMLGIFFIKQKCKIHFIPVQPTFQTTQVYVLVENISEFTDDMFQKIIAIKQQPFFPIVKTYNQLIKNLFTSSYFDIESFRDVYIINILSKKEVKINKNVITYKLLPTLLLDILTKSNYNLRYISYPNFMPEIDNKSIYDTPSSSNMYDVLNKISKKREKFIDENKLLHDSNGEINVKKVNITSELLIKINKFVEKVNNIFIGYLE